VLPDEWDELVLGSAVQGVVHVLDDRGLDVAALLADGEVLCQLGGVEVAEAELIIVVGPTVSLALFVLFL